MRTLKTWAVWSLGIKTPSLQVDSIHREVLVRVPPERNPFRRTRTWGLCVSALGLSDDPAAFLTTLHKYLLGDDTRVSASGLRVCVSSHDPCLFHVENGTGHSVREFTARIDDVLGSGEQGITQKTQVCLMRRFGASKVQEARLRHVSMEIARQTDCSATVNQNVFAGELHLSPTSVGLWMQRQRPVDSLSQWNSVYVCWPQHRARTSVPA